MSKPEKLTSISEIIKKRREEAAIKEGYVALFGRIILLIIITYLLFTQVFFITRAAGNGMFPAIKDSDLLFGYRLQQHYEKNNVVAYKVDGERYIGRILARGTDVIDMDENGTLKVNGTVQAGEITFPTYAKIGIEYPYQVPEGHVFVLGDYRTQTKDSRDLGSISMENVEGKVITILRRREL